MIAPPSDSRIAITAAWTAARDQLRAGGCLALAVPSSIDVLAHLRRTGEREWNQWHVRTAARVYGLQIADGDP